MPHQIQFAPLQGYTDAIYRNAFNTIFGSVETYYSPFLRLENDHSFRNKDLYDINPANNTGLNLVPQILPKNAKETAILTDLVVKNGYRAVDINMGCPFAMVVKSGRGSGLLVQPEEIKAILTEACNRTDLTVSVKIRLGHDTPDELLQLLPVFEQYPLGRLTVHARTTKQQYIGQCHTGHFAQIYQVAKLPLVYNGDINSLQDFEAISAQFPKLAGVMMGRGLLMNPFLAAECHGLTFEDKASMILNFHDQLAEKYSRKLCGEAQILAKLKTIWDYLLPDIEKKRRKAIVKSRTYNSYNTAVSESVKSYFANE